MWMKNILIGLLVLVSSTAIDVDHYGLLDGISLSEFNPMGSGSTSLTKTELSELVVFSDEVKQALDAKNPVVALESTVICHGLPYPQNLETVLAVEAIIRHEGAVPATVAIIDGKVHIGLQGEELEHFAKSLCSSALKVSRRDLAFVVGTGKHGATTVSATSLIASKVGIKVFVTGGIGGVHRDGQSSMDISADLTELGRTPIAVVCAGVKSILDIGRTLEYLETQGVPVIGYQTNEFPAFFTPKSGFQTSARVDSPEECARVIAASHLLRLNSGMIIAVPIRKEDAAEAAVVETATQKALAEATANHVTGKEVTPFVLSAVNRLTHGESLRANIALLKNNAKIGASIAVALSKKREVS